MINSCLYRCTVMHHRFSPRANHFEHSIFMFYLDLDEIDALAKRLTFFSRDRFNLFTICDRDHEPSGSKPLKELVGDYLRKNGMPFEANHRVMLLTLPRVLGYVFNPISIYFCFDAQGQPTCAIAEVGNTFHEKKLYLVRKDEEGFRQIVAKNFYVSPFSPLDLNFDFKFDVPAQGLNIQIDDLAVDQKVLASSLHGARAALTDSNLLWFSVVYPLVTLKVIFLIHWHALLLWFRKFPLHRKSTNAHLQQEVLRPHSSLQPKPR